MHTVRSILSVGALPSGFSLAPSHNLRSLPAVCTAGCWAGIPMAMVFNDDALKVATLLTSYGQIVGSDRRHHGRALVYMRSGRECSHPAGARPTSMEHHQRRRLQ